MPLKTALQKPFQKQKLRPGKSLTLKVPLLWILLSAPLRAETTPAPSNLDAVALPCLKGVVVEPAGNIRNLRKNRVISVRGLGLPHRREVRDLILPYLGHPLTFRKMHELTGRIAIYYRLHDRPFVDVTVPPQRVQEGVLHVDVQEYRLGHMTVHGNRWMSARSIRRDSGLRPDQTLPLTALQTDLDWLNMNPFRTVDMLWRPGTQPGTADVDLHVADRFPIYAYAAVNNQADATLGRLNWYVGATWGNAFGLGQILTYQFNRTFSGLANSHAASWTIPLMAHQSIQIFGSYSEARPIADAPLRNRGRSGQVSLRWLHMLTHVALGRFGGLDGSVQLGFDWKTTNSDQFYVQQPIVLANADTDQFMAGYTGSLQDSWGQWQFNNQFFYGPGGLTQYDHERDYYKIFPSARPNYVYDRLMITRSLLLGPGFTGTFRASFQRASKNLLYSEQLMTGGLGNARGYYANTSFGSNANTFSEQIDGPAFSIGKTLGLPTLQDSNRLGAFWDWADNHQVVYHGTGPHAATLSSIGAAANSTVNQYLTATYDVGWRLRRTHTNPIGGKRGVFCDFQIITGF